MKTQPCGCTYPSKCNTCDKCNKCEKCSCNTHVKKCKVTCDPCDPCYTIESSKVEHCGIKVSTILDKYAALNLDASYNMSCLTNGTDGVSSFEAINQIKNHICSTTAPVFDTSCLGGSSLSTQQQAISLLITRVCNVANPLPFFDNTCLGGTSNDSLQNTVQTLLNKTCSSEISSLSLDWSCFTDPVSTDLNVVLQTILSEIVKNKVVFNTDHFIPDTSNPCSTTISIDKDEISTIVYNNFIENNEFNELIENYITNNFSYKIYKDDLCVKKYLIQAFSVTDGIEMKQTCFSLHTYSFTTTVNIAEWKVLSIELPTGISYDVPTAYQSDASLIEDWLGNSLGVIMPNVSVTPQGQLTITFQTYGNTTTKLPKLTLIPSNNEGTVTLNVSNASLADSSNTCCTLELSLDTSNIVLPETNEKCISIVGDTGICVEKYDKCLLDTSLNAPRNYSFLGFTDANGTTYTYTGNPITINDTVDVYNYLNSLGVGSFNIPTNNSFVKVITYSYTGKCDESPINPPYISVNTGSQNIDINFSNYTLSDVLCEEHKISLCKSDTDCEVEVVGLNGITAVTREVQLFTWRVPNHIAYNAEFFTRFNYNGRDYIPFPALAVSDVTGINTYLNSLGIGTFTYSITAIPPLNRPPVGDWYINFSFKGYSFTTPQIFFTDGSTRLDIFDSEDKYCPQIIVENEFVNWQNVTYKNGWTGNIQYRVLHDRVEIKGGDILKTITVDTEYKLFEDSFSFPGINSTIKRVYSAYGQYEYQFPGIGIAPVLDYSSLDTAFEAQRKGSGINNQTTQLTFDNQAAVELKDGSFYAYFALYRASKHWAEAMDDFAAFNLKMDNYPSQSVLAWPIRNASELSGNTNPTITIHVPDMTIFTF